MENKEKKLLLEINWLVKKQGVINDPLGQNQNTNSSDYLFQYSDHYRLWPRGSNVYDMKY